MRHHRDRWAEPGFNRSSQQWGLGGGRKITSIASAGVLANFPYGPPDRRRNDLSLSRNWIFQDTSLPGSLSSVERLIVLLLV